MKIIKKYTIALVTFILVLAGCEQELTMIYDKGLAAVNFTGSVNYYQYSFLKSGKQVDTVSIVFEIVGLDADVDRSATFEIVKDSTTAEAADYEIVSTTVKAGEFKGELKVKVNRPAGDDFEDRRIYFRTKDGDEFKVGMPNRSDFYLVLTNKLTPAVHWIPGGWKSRYFLGNYSTAYYKFIIEATGITEYPYPWPVPGYNNGKAWSYTQKNAFISMLKEKLMAYNESIAPDVLMHDDGIAAGQPVVPGKYYSN